MLWCSYCVLSGYGDAAPDMGYGDGAPSEDYGYGDSAPSEDYGYGDSEPAAPCAAEKKRPKRRCSVTKFSLEEEDGPQSGLMAADVIKSFRNAAASSQPEPVVDDCKSTLTDDTRSMDSEISPVEPGEVKGGRRMGGMMSRLRKRLSVQ